MQPSPSLLAVGDGLGAGVAAGLDGPVAGDGLGADDGRVLGSPPGGRGEVRRPDGCMLTAGCVRGGGRALDDEGLWPGRGAWTWPGTVRPALAGA
jgi:hypothetical protein